MNQRDQILIACNEVYRNREMHLTEEGQITFKDGLEYDLNLIMQKVLENNNNKPMSELRKLRNIKLQESDVYMLSDYPISVDRKNQLLTYRSALRNLPEVLTNSGVQVDINNLEQYFMNLL